MNWSWGFTVIYVTMFAVVIVLLLSGCADFGKLACYDTMLFQDCKLTGER